MSYSDDDLNLYWQLLPYEVARDIPGGSPYALGGALAVYELLGEQAPPVVKGFPTAALALIRKHRNMRGQPGQPYPEVLRDALLTKLTKQTPSDRELEAYRQALPSEFAHTAIAHLHAALNQLEVADKLHDDDILEGIPVEMLRVLLRYRRLHAAGCVVTLTDVQRILRTIHDRRKRKESMPEKELQWTDYEEADWHSAVCQAYLYRYQQEIGYRYQQDIGRAGEGHEALPRSGGPVRRYYCRHDNKSIPVTKSPIAGFYNDGSGTLLNVRSWLPSEEDLKKRSAQAAALLIDVRDFKQIPINPPQAPEKKIMATEEITNPSKKSKKTIKEQASLLGGAMAQGVGMGLTNQAGEVLLEMASALAPGNKYIQDALKDPAGREIIKVTMAVLLHTACESGAPLPGAAHIATATRSQVAFSSAILTGYAMKNLGTQLTSLATLGQQLAELPSAVPVEREDFEEAEVEAKAAR